MPQKTAAPSLQIRALTERLGQDPRSRVFLDLAKAHLAAGDPGEAVRVCREGLEKHPRYHSARVFLGKALVAAGSHGEAASELEKVVTEAPDNILARRLLAEAQEAGCRRGDALSTYRSLLLLTPGEPEVEARIADLEAGTGEAAPVAPLP
ncbi:MAG TPA: tetratricopeptide repeat protein, partial [Candidatus Saccharimonadales bacterium]|nr:tetratricopeptide repeat protein [Candidatus Saccharimonadales bacterium]